MNQELQICYCKKAFNEHLIDKRSDDSDGVTIIFEKDRYYNFYFEDFNYVWVIYNENANKYKGLRFHANKANKGKVHALFPFYKFFDYGRLMKLKKLNKIAKKILIENEKI